MYKDAIFSAGQPAGDIRPEWCELGFKFGDKGAHTSRTMMLDEISALLRTCPADCSRAGYEQALVIENCLGSTHSPQAFDPATDVGTLRARSIRSTFPVCFAVLVCGRKGTRAVGFARGTGSRSVASGDGPGHSIHVGGGGNGPTRLTDAVRQAVGGRLNDDTLDKVVSNTASSLDAVGPLGWSEPQKARG